MKYRVFLNKSKNCTLQFLASCSHLTKVKSRAEENAGFSSFYKLIPNLLPHVFLSCHYFDARKCPWCSSHLAGTIRYNHSHRARPLVTIIWSLNQDMRRQVSLSRETIEAIYLSSFIYTYVDRPIVGCGFTIKPGIVPSGVGRSL